MSKTTRPQTRDSIERLRQENAELRSRLELAEATLHALAAGEVDAVVVSDRERVLTLELPDMPYRLAVEQMSHPAVTLTQEGSIIYANRRFAELLGVVQSELAGKPLATFVLPKSRSSFDALLRDAAGDGAGALLAEVTLKGDAGLPVSVCLGACMLREGALGPCVVVSDLTMQRQYEDLRRTQEALQASERDLREADRRKDEFVATLAHELRNPLAPIRNAVQALKTKGLPDDLQWGRDVIDRQVSVMARLLEDLLDVSRISLHRLDLRRERVALASVLDAALETSRPVIAVSRHALTVTVPPQPVMLDADPVRLAQVLANLLNNAAKYTDEGGAIQVTAAVQGRELTLSVKDSGIGIAPEMLPQIFEIFSQAKSAQLRSQGGLGIGLALVKGLVDLHGGAIEVRSQGLGRGSEFIVRLPCVINA
ncbi:MAG TPA: PAS domain-containing sensor histidine kinase [Gemmatimonadales bacterium]|nr:PAS domain-containing sensor histidine kinase [Gemmatimonadales bacterium]